MNIHTISPDVFNAKNRVYEQINTQASNLFNMLFKDKIAERDAEKARQGLIQSQQIPETPEPAGYANKPYPALSALGVGATTETSLPVAPMEESPATSAAMPSPLGMLMKNAPEPIKPAVTTPEPGVMQKLPLLGGLFKKTPTVESTTQVPTPDYVPPERAINEQIARGVPSGMGKDYYEKVSLYGETPTAAKVMGKAMEEALRTGDYTKVEMLKRIAAKQNIQLVANAEGGMTAVDKNAVTPGAPVPGLETKKTYQLKPVVVEADESPTGKRGVFLGSFDPTKPSAKPIEIGQEVTDPMQVAMARAKAWNESKPMWVFNADLGRQVLTNAKGDMLLQEGWYNPQEQRTSAPLVQQAADIYRTAHNVRDAAAKLANPQGFFARPDVAQYISLLDHSSATGDFSMPHQMINSELKRTLTPDQYHYLVTLSNLYEGSMSARNFLGVSARTSDQQRRMVVMTLPDATDISPAQVSDKIRQYEDLVHTLSQSVPNVPAPNGVTMQQVNDDMLARRNGLPYEQSLLNRLVTMPSTGVRGAGQPAPVRPQTAPAVQAPAAPAAPGVGGNIFDQ